MVSGDYIGQHSLRVTIKTDVLFLLQNRKQCQKCEVSCLG